MTESNVLPLERADVEEKVRRFDGWQSMITGLGVAQKDKRLSYTYARHVRSPDELEEIYRGDDMAATIVDSLPDDAVREGWELTIPKDKRGDAKRIQDFHEEIGINEAIHEALIMARLTGGAGILLGVEDGRLADVPLEPERVRDFRWATVFSARELRPWRYYSDARAKDYSRPELYEVSELGFTGAGGGAGTRLGVGSPRVHESRILRFDGVKLPRRLARGNRSWGDSVLHRVFQVVQDFQVSWAAASVLLQEFATTIHKVEGLLELISSGEDALVVKRAELAAICKSVLNAVMIDSKEEISREVVPLTGMPEMLQQMAIRVAAAARMPVTRLMGQSPAGLNATGASDIRNWFDSVRAYQVRTILPALNRVTRYSFRALKIQEPATWWWNFNPLWTMTDAERAELRYKVAQTDKTYVFDIGSLTPDEVRAARHGAKWSMETSVELDATIPDELEPGEPGSADVQTPADPNAADPSTAFNGSQVESLIGIIEKVASGTIPRASAVKAIAMAFPVTEAEADAVLGEAGKGFEPSAPKPSAGAPPPGVASFGETAGQEPTEEEPEDEAEG